MCVQVKLGETLFSSQPPAEPEVHRSKGLIDLHYTIDVESYATEVEESTHGEYQGFQPPAYVPSRQRSSRRVSQEPSPSLPVIIEIRSPTVSLSAGRSITSANGPTHRSPHQLTDNVVHDPNNPLNIASRGLYFPKPFEDPDDPHYVPDWWFGPSRGPPLDDMANETTLAIRMRAIWDHVPNRNVKAEDSHAIQRFLETDLSIDCEEMYQDLLLCQTEQVKLTEPGIPTMPRAMRNALLASSLEVPPSIQSRSTAASATSYSPLADWPSPRSQHSPSVNALTQPKASSLSLHAIPVYAPATRGPPATFSAKRPAARPITNNYSTPENKMPPSIAPKKLQLLSTTPIAPGVSQQHLYATRPHQPQQRLTAIPALSTANLTAFNNSMSGHKSPPIPYSSPFISTQARAQQLYGSTVPLPRASTPILASQHRPQQLQRPQQLYPGPRLPSPLLPQHHSHSTLNTNAAQTQYQRNSPGSINVKPAPSVIQTFNRFR